MQAMINKYVLTRSQCGPFDRKVFKFSYASILGTTIPFIYIILLIPFQMFYIADVLHSFKLFGISSKSLTSF
jgi:hypothetical protein